jgi:hypothetical protein
VTKWRSIFIPPSSNIISIKHIKNNHPTTEPVASLSVNHLNHMPSAVANTGAGSSTILEAYTSKNLVKKAIKDNEPLRIQRVVSLQLEKLD